MTAKRSRNRRSWPSNNWTGLKISWSWLALLLLVPFAPAVTGQLRISEFMASNSRTLKDEDGSFVDWIEIQNTSSTNVHLAGWALTDSINSPRKWIFPSTNLNRAGFMIVFASGKDRVIAGRPLHTNFKLKAAGDYLALISPAGVNLSPEFEPKYPQQFPDVSYGVSRETTSLSLIGRDAPARWLVPANESASDAWTQLNFADDSWPTGINSLGYDTGLADPLEDSYAGRVLQTNPLLYWRLDETNGVNALNLGSMGRSGDGLYQGGIVLGGAGPRSPRFSGFELDNRAPQFNGLDSYLGGPTALLDNVSEFTMAAWIAPAGVEGNRTGLFGQNDAIEFGFIDATTIQLWTPFNSINTLYPFPSNEWHHVAAVGDGTHLALFFDGAIVASSAGAVPTYPASGFNFNAGGGGVFDASGNPFLGQIDEIAVWQRALSPNEITNLVSRASSEQISYSTNIVIDVQSQMFGINSSIYVRLPFNVVDPASLDQLTLRMRYDDGFVAFLNGHELARKNAPELLFWNSSATARHPDVLAVDFEEFDVTFARGFLTPGTNVLAIQGLNITSTNKDFLLQAELLAIRAGLTGDTYRYLVSPTPGTPNGAGSADLGPIFLQVIHTPPVPRDNDDLVVTAVVGEAFNRPVSNITLHYRILFDPEIQLAMNDGGTNGDAVAGDGIWTAVIPATASGPGQMIRYALTATDAQGHSSRWPLFSDPTDSEQYLGTVVADARIQSQLPVVHLFVPKTSALDSGTPVRGALFYEGELYDNVRFDVHGQSSAGWPKKGYNIDFNRDHRFRYRDGEEREKDITLMSPYGDKTRMHTSLTYAELAEAGGAGHLSFQVRVQRNASFYGIESLVENGDDHWLKRLGRDPNGALYKMYNDMSSAGGNEKKTRTSEDFSDLQGLINSLSESRPLTDRVVDAYDHLDLPQTISYFATLALVSSQDHGHKNYYLYRDTAGTGEWTIFPWDVDLSWGRNWVDSLGYFSDIFYQNNSLTFYNSAQQGKPANRLYDLIFNHPDFRRMYLRRLRTLMDTILMPPGTATNALKIEARIRQFEDLMAPPGASNTDAELDRALWGPGWGNPAYDDLRVEAERTISVHLPGRRDFLFNSALAAVKGERIPEALPPNSIVTIAAVDFNPASGNQDEEYVQLLNTNSYAVDLSGWTLGGVGRFTFKPGTVIPSAGSLFVSPNVNAFRSRAASPRGGQGLYVQGNYAGHLSAWGETITLKDNAGRLVATNSYAGNPSLAQQFLRITEIMYNPAVFPGNTNDPQQFEYLELKNISSAVSLDLTGVSFTKGVSFHFTTGMPTNLAPGQSMLVVRNLGAFRARYGTGPFAIAGEFSGALDNAGETLRLEDAAGETILEFAYDNQWYPLTDALGFSLVIVDEQAPWANWGQRASWRASTTLNGSPGVADPVSLAFPKILVNEVLPQSSHSETDTIELFNSTPNAVDLGGWFLTDDFFNPKKYRIPSGTTVAPGAYAVLTSHEFGQGTNAFRLSVLGGQVYLFSADPNANLTGYAHGFSFGPTPAGLSVGRYVSSVGSEDFVFQSASTIGTNNVYPQVGPVVISEIMSAPPESDATNSVFGEFLELQNITANDVPLYDPAHPTNTWQLRNAVGFDFPTNVWLTPGAGLLIVSFDPTNAAQLNLFRATYNVPTNLPVFGPWSGRLDNSGDSIELQRPGGSNEFAPTVDVPYYLVEKIDYQNHAPWPTNANGSGNSLQRLELTLFGNDPINWQAAPPTAGQPNWPGQSPDTDGDGIPDRWELTNGTDPMTDDANADPDKDGFSNWQEYWAGTNPTLATSSLRFTAVHRPSATNIVLEFSIPSHRTYQLEYRESLASTDWSLLQNFPPAATNRLVQFPEQVRVSRYYRLVVPAPP